jgi:hypothetical protein
VLGLTTLRGTTLRAPAKMFYDYLHTVLKARR